MVREMARMERIEPDELGVEGIGRSEHESDDVRASARLAL